VENKNNTLAIGISTLVLGLIIGYFVGAGRTTMPMQLNSSDIHGAMDSMTSGLTGKTGDALDKAFLDDMIVHHEGAVQMAQTLLSGTKRPELLNLSKNIITAQTQEIQMMKDWRKKWFNQ
jgi:uncharacterized protein (DUF305 family)